MSDSVSFSGVDKQNAAFLNAPGEMAARMRDHDWLSSSLGDPTNWPQTLRTVVRLILNTQHPMYIWWGDDNACLYNDAYRQLIGPEQHPGSLGRPAREVWAEIWDVIAPQIDQVRSGGGATWHANDLIPFTRNGRREDVYWTYSYSPIDDPATPNGIGGVLVVCNETTGQVLAEQRLASEVARQRQMFKLAPGFIAVLTGPDHIFEFVNEAYVRLTGERQHVGRPVRQLFPEVEGQGFFELLDQVYASGERVVVTRVPISLQRVPGQTIDERFIDFIYEPVRDDNGTVTGIFVEGHDVTEAHRDELALAAIQGRQMFLIETADRLRSIRDARIVMAESARLLGERLAVDRVGYAEIDDDGASFEVRDDWTAGDMPSLVGRHQLEVFGPALIAQLRAGRTAVFADAFDHRLTVGDEARRAYTGASTRAAITVPLIKNSRFAVAFYVHARRPRVWTEDEQQMVRDFAERTWAAVERARAEEALVESEAHYRYAVELNPQVAWTAMPDGQLDRVAERWREWTGGTGLGWLWAEAIHPDDRDRSFDDWQSSVATGAPYDIEHRARMLSGEYRWMHSRASPRRNDAGEIVRWYGSTEDIHGRKAAEAQLKAVEVAAREDLEREVAARTKELREREAQLRAVFSTTHLFQGLLDIDGTVRDANAASLEAIDARLEEVVGKKLWETQWFSGTPGIVERVRLATAEAAGGATTDFPVDAILPTGNRSFEFSLRPILDGDGRVTAILPEAIETTARLQAEAALRQSQKMDAMGQLTGGVAHDFNNLLTPIIGSLDMLVRRRVGNEREQRLIDGALKSADRAKTLVQRLLAFARRQPLQAVPVDVGGLVQGMADLIASTTGPQISVTLDIEKDLPAACADANQLEMAILNLSVNARDAMPDGGLLAITAAKAANLNEGQPALLRLSVRDTGMGMDELTVAQAVEPFFSTKGVGKGTGLGLSMVHGLVAQLGGELAIESAPGKGTTISLLLPVASERSKSDEAVEKVQDSVGGRGTVLLVDDEELVRISTADMLNDLGYLVIEATSADEALRLIGDGHEVDILVTDHLMPGMTGAELALQLRQLRPGTPVLIVSGYADSYGLSPELPRLTKPFRQSELAEMIASII